MHDAGTRLGAEFLQDALVYRSPYRRARQTLDCILAGAGVPGSGLRIDEDPRLREVDHGYGDVVGQDDLRRVHGWFYYRSEGGASPADCFDRTSGFVKSMMRHAERKSAAHVPIVTRGLTIRCCVMRFRHLSAEGLETLDDPRNCDVITTATRRTPAAPMFTSSAWEADGLRLREEA